MSVGSTNKKGGLLSKSGARSPGPSNGSSSLGSPRMSSGLGSPRASCSSSGAGRDLWFTGEVAKIGALGNMRDVLRQEDMLRREASVKEKERSVESEKAKLQAKYARKIRSNELFEEYWRIERIKAADLRHA